MKRYSLLAIPIVVLALAAASCGDNGGSGGSPTATQQESVAPASPEAVPTEPALPQGGDPFDVDPANFVDVIDNPLWPMTPGNRWVFNEIDEEGNTFEVEVVVLDEKRDVAGISATVVRDIVTENGEVIEDTFDWYAQDIEGNIWYLGEDTKEYEDGEVVTTAGSWEHGVDGALAGILVLANPEAGLSYRQEYYAGEAEDLGRVIALNQNVEVPFGSFDGCLQTEDTTPLEPDVLEHKYYCPGVGPVLAVDVAGGGGREELITFEAASQ